jgi:hypothetical protein
MPPMVGKQQWDIINLGFVLHALVQGRAPGRPRKSRIRSSGGQGWTWGQGSETVRDVKVLDILQELVKMWCMHPSEKMSIGV